MTVAPSENEANAAVVAVVDAGVVAGVAVTTPATDRIKAALETRAVIHLEAMPTSSRASRTPGAVIQDRARRRAMLNLNVSRNITLNIANLRTLTIGNTRASPRLPRRHRSLARRKRQLRVHPEVAAAAVAAAINLPSGVRRQAAAAARGAAALPAGRRGVMNNQEKSRL